MKSNELQTLSPTIGFNFETVIMNNIEFTIWETGGRENIRKHFKIFQEGSNVFVIVIDSRDKDRIPEVKNEIVSDLKNEYLKDVIVLFFANKQDIPGALTCAELVELLDLSKIQQNWSIQPISAMEGTGIQEGFDWIAKNLPKR
jgi:ADP-ribosylation factor 1/2